MTHLGGKLSARNKNSKAEMASALTSEGSQSTVRGKAFAFASEIMAHVSLLCWRKNPTDTPWVQEFPLLMGWSGEVLAAFGSPVRVQKI